ncbi:hypothetical protein BKA15_002547 [Microlunatus parietis]|uniref:Uncharacterized protein n=1 Tax=Microlunatus parietis TaxID=682979 RepID=A0A7Y9LBU9_9ACTN|nr:hypothetical protein [Microlunatus parietis]
MKSIFRVRNVTVGVRSGPGHGAPRRVRLGWPLCRDHPPRGRFPRHSHHAPTSAPSTSTYPLPTPARADARPARTPAPRGVPPRTESPAGLPLRAPTPCPRGVPPPAPTSAQRDLGPADLRTARPGHHSQPRARSHPAPTSAPRDLGPADLRPPTSALPVPATTPIPAPLPPRANFDPARPWPSGPSPPTSALPVPATRTAPASARADLHTPGLLLPRAKSRLARGPAAPADSRPAPTLAPRRLRPRADLPQAAFRTCSPLHPDGRELRTSPASSPRSAWSTSL